MIREPALRERTATILPADSRSMAPARHWRTLADDLAGSADNFLLLRFLAAAAVIYGHGPAITGGSGPPDLFVWLGWGRYSGSIAVDLFFLISGFLVTGSFLRRRDVAGFIWARALRIVPGYAVCVAGCAGVLGALLTTWPLADYLRAPATRDYVLTNLGFDHVLWQLPGVFGSNPQRDVVNGSLWTLPAEVRMYVGVAFLGVFSVLQRRWLCNGVLLALFVIGLLAPDNLPLVLIPAHLHFAGMFALGTLCYVNRDIVPRHGAVVVASVMLAFALHSTALYPFAFALAEAAFAFWFAYGLPWHAFNRAGDYSYGIYLWGYPMQQLVAHAAPALTPIANSVCGFVLALALAVASWHFVEQPALRFKRLPALMHEHTRIMLRRHGHAFPRFMRALFGLEAYPHAGRWWRHGFVAVLAITSLLYLWTSLVAIANFAFRYPAFDQLRFYAVYLGLPFPGNAVQLENGHRPILPALLRIAEIHWLAADQWLQIGAGCAALLLALAVMVATILREATLSAVNRAAACLFVVLALLWLGNARMLMHGNELAHVYFVMLFSVLAMAAMRRACVRGSIAWSLLAALCCVGATFSFGTGIASFFAIAAIGIVLGARWRVLVPILAILISTLGIYLFVLPAAGAARASLAFDPIDVPGHLLRWLSSPWMHAWLGYSDPALDPSLATSAAFRHGTGGVMAAAARALATSLGDDAVAWESRIVGAAGVCGYVLIALHGWRKRALLGRTRVLAFGLSTFALVAGALVCVNRAQAWTAVPSQVLADRYLPWSCLFWLGLALYACGGARDRKRDYAFAAGALVSALALLPSDRVFAGWSATVHRNVQQSAVAAQLGIWDPLRFPDGDDARRADVLDTLERLRRQHLSMYSEPAYALIEKGWTAAAPIPSTTPDAGARILREFDDTLGLRRVAAFEGWLPHIEHLPRNPVICVVDASGKLRGLAKTSFIGPEKKTLRLNRPRKRGFDGYVLDPQAGEALRVVVLGASGQDVIASVDLRIPQALPE